MYTYRYSTEPSITVSCYCPICRAKQEINIEGSVGIKHKHTINTDVLCCSKECAELYEKKIHRAITWIRESQSYRLDAQTKKRVLSEHYNGISVPQERSTLAKLLSSLGQYFPFANAHNYRVR